MRSALTILLGAVALFGAAAPAHAGEYTVWGCRTPDGRIVATAGWTAGIAPSGAGSAHQHCLSSEPGFTAELARGSAVPNEARVYWRFTAPPGRTIAAFTLWRVTNGAANADPRWYQFADALVDPGVAGSVETVDSCSQERCTGSDPLSDDNALQIAGRDARTITFQVHCVAPPPATGCTATETPARYRVARSAIRLNDLADPLLTAPPSGGLVDPDRTLSGVQGLSISARDEGAGLYEAALEIDGREVTSRRFDDNDGACRLPFTALDPCRLVANLSLSYDTAQLADGGHDVRVLVRDATQTNTVAYGPVRITTANGAPGPPNGRNASAQARLSVGIDPRGRTSATVRYGRSAALRGRLIDEQGRPIADATLDLAARQERLGAAMQALGTVRTGADGRFRYIVAAGPSRSVVVSYRARLGDPNAAATATVTLRVPAAATLAASPRRLAPGGTVRFTGRLRGRPLPRSGKLIDLQARERGRWKTFDSVRTGARGRFAAKLRFTRRARRVTYPFRARVRRDESYPYALGLSRAVRVRVG